MHIVKIEHFHEPTFVRYVECRSLLVWAHRSRDVLLRHQVISATWNQVAPPMFLCVMQGEAIPGQAHQLRGHPHL